VLRFDQMNRREFIQRSATTIAFAVGLPPHATGQTPDMDTRICMRAFDFARAQKLRDRSIGKVIVQMGMQFLGSPYAAHTLEVPGEERVVVNLRGFDCVSLCEASLVLARCIKKGTPSYEAYGKELQRVRYRGGALDGYPSRLHYFTDWIDDNASKGILTNVTKELGGESVRKKINFMTSHPHSYRQLAESAEIVESMKRHEERLSEKEFMYIPKERVSASASFIRDGDILAITTSIEGLDVLHTGLAVWQKRELCMLHAPEAGKKVSVTASSLDSYLRQRTRHTGIIVARAVEV
jgi:hypothetical protein